MKDWTNLANIATSIGLLITLFGILIIYFGKGILKSRRELTKDTTSEVLNGILFLIQCIIIPGIIIYLIYWAGTKYLIPLIFLGEGISCVEFVKLLGGSIIIAIQYGIFWYYKDLKEKKAKTGVVYITSIFNLLAMGWFIYSRNWYYLSASIIFIFLILTFMMIKDPFRNEENDNSNKILNITYDQAGKKKEIKGKLIRLGDDFYDFEISGKKVTLNKSHIISIKNLEENKK
jgi:hypothetical protein